jgi:hypothetical protein
MSLAEQNKLQLFLWVSSVRGVVFLQKLSNYDFLTACLGFILSLFESALSTKAKCETILGYFVSKSAA